MPPIKKAVQKPADYSFGHRCKKIRWKCVSIITNRMPLWNGTITEGFSELRFLVHRSVLSGSCKACVNTCTYTMCKSKIFPTHEYSVCAMISFSERNTYPLTMSRCIWIKVPSVYAILFGIPAIEWNVAEISFFATCTAFIWSQKARGIELIAIYHSWHGSNAYTILFTQISKRRSMHIEFLRDD